MILLIDDDVFGMKAYRLVLEDMGDYRVRNVMNADEAVDGLKAHEAELDLVILDVMMPSGKVFEEAETDYGLKTGRLLLKHITKRYPGLPVVVFSITDSESLGESLASGNVIFLSKANTLPSDLLEKVNEILKPEGREGEGGGSA